MRQIRIFLASSAALENFRKELTIKIAEKNKIWNPKNLNLELVIWEHLTERVQLTRSQDAYNREIAKCHMFVLLASGSLGKYSHEEFMSACKLFQSDGRPKVLVYLKEGVKSDKSLQRFQKYLQKLEHFPAYYKSFDDLWDKLYKEIEMYLHTVWKNMDSREKHDTLPKKIGEMPLYPKVFIGREGKLAKIYQAFFEEGKPVLLLSGEGGLGKTTTAARYYHKYEESYSHMIWAVNQNQIDDTLLSLATHLQLKFDEKMPKEAQINTLLNAIDSLQKPVLLVIDNVDDYEDLRENHRYLQHTPNIHILITTRLTRFHEFEKLDINRLTLQKAKKLFLYHYKQYDSKEEDILQSILEATGYNTLSIELLAKNLNSTKIIGYNLHKLLEDLQNEGLLHLSAAVNVPHTYRTLQSATPDKIVKAMYNIAPLSEKELKLLSLFSLLPEMFLAFDDVREISPLKEEDLQKVIIDLTEKAWLEVDEANTGFKINTIIATIIREERQESLYDNAKKMIAKTKDVLKYDAITGMVQAYDKAVRYVGYAKSFLEYLKEVEIDLSFVADGVGNFHQYYGQLSRALEFYEKRNKLTEELYNLTPNNIDFKYNSTISYEKLGSVYESLGDMDMALVFYEKHYKLIKELHNLVPDNLSFKNGLAISYEKLGGVYENSGNMDKALLFYEKDLKVIKKLHNLVADNLGFKNGLAISYLKLGGVYESLSNMDKALGFYEKYNKLKEELCKLEPDNINFKNGLAISYFKLGKTFHKKGDFQKTKKFLDKAIAIFLILTKLSPEYIGFIANLGYSYYELSRLYLSMEDCEKSQKFANLSQNILEDIVQKHSEIKEYQKDLIELLEHIEKIKHECG